MVAHAHTQLSGSLPLQIHHYLSLDLFKYCQLWYLYIHLNVINYIIIVYQMLLSSSFSLTHSIALYFQQSQLIMI